MDQFIGAHCSISGGFFNAVKEAHSIGANCAQIFTSNQRQWNSKTISEKDIDLWKEAKDQFGVHNFFSHASYLINLGSDDQSVLEKSINAIRSEIIRCQALEIHVLNFHPGSHKSLSLEEGIIQIIKSLKNCQDLFDKKNYPIMCLETTAGQGTQIGSKFEEIATIIDQTSKYIPNGYCIDTCHVHSSGYDIKGETGINNMLDKLEKLMPIEKICMLHINDSKGQMGSKIDRHASLGFGTISLDTFEAIMKNEKLIHVPKILETPENELKWVDEIKMLKSFNQK